MDEYIRYNGSRIKNIRGGGLYKAVTRKTK